MKSETIVAVAICVLLALSVPWYFPAGSGAPLVLGFPLWGFVSMCCLAAIAVLVVWRLPQIWHRALRRAEEDETS